MRLFGYPVSGLAVAGIGIIALNLAAAAFAPMIAPHDQTEMIGDIWAAPSPEAWLGLDNLGRDMFSRLLYGARTTITVALLTTTLSFALGGTAGFVAATVGG